MEAHEAVHLVITALQLQGDEEMTARLSRKNREVMDRLNQVQEYKRGLLTSLRLAYARCVILELQHCTSSHYIHNTQTQISTCNKSCKRIPLQGANLRRQ